MPNNRRRAERKREIAELRTDGALARQQGKPRSAVSWKPFQSTNAGHWLDGWNAEDERLRREAVEALTETRNIEHARLLATITLYERHPNPPLLAAILRAMAERLPPIVEDLTQEDYETIYGWGGQG